MSKSGLNLSNIIINKNPKLLTPFGNTQELAKKYAKSFKFFSAVTQKSADAERIELGKIQEACKSMNRNGNSFIVTAEIPDCGNKKEFNAIGYTIATAQGPFLKVTRVFVSPEFRDEYHTLANKMLGALVECSKDKGNLKVQFWCEKDDDYTRKVAKNCGAKRVVPRQMSTGVYMPKRLGDRLLAIKNKAELKNTIIMEK